jgi:WD40 repeat protein
VAFSPDSKWLLTWDARPRSAILWDTATLSEAHQLLRTLEGPVRQAVFSSDGKSLLLACRDGTARFWDVDRDEEIDPDHRPRHGYPVTAVAFDPHAPRVVTGCQAGTVGVWDLTKGTLLHDVRGNAGEVGAVAFSPDGRMLLTASHDGMARFWDVESGKQLGPPLRHTDAVLCATFHPDGRSVATGSKDGTVQRWHVPAAPEQRSVAEIRTWIDMRTGLELDQEGMVHTSSVGPHDASGE